ncbi:pentatricopeptide repeat (PPR) superfamily protein [Actinidia rufa]|uniref:Pentatricopeptide repeat (PPR) superfamily protein n=1 Tax=Actinidia rufa TaxID=165716 RepID=A0A7J0GG80_9ERIC|nr:pentatricopeptide repeat (PPR) superfamily protein [Actinidia rufa]
MFSVVLSINKDRLWIVVKGIGMAIPPKPDRGLAEPAVGYGFYHIFCPMEAGMGTESGPPTHTLAIPKKEHVIPSSNSKDKLLYGYISNCQVAHQNGLLAARKTSGTMLGAPLKQRNLREEFDKVHKGLLVLGQASYRDHLKVKLGLDKVMEFYYWVETHFGFTHSEMTYKEMACDAGRNLQLYDSLRMSFNRGKRIYSTLLIADVTQCDQATRLILGVVYIAATSWGYAPASACVLARGNRLIALWEFLKEMARRGSGGLVTTAIVTCLMKVLGEEGFLNEALAAFYRMRQFLCKPDVYAYNTIIYTLCKVHVQQNISDTDPIPMSKSRASDTDPLQS